MRALQDPTLLVDRAIPRVRTYTGFYPLAPSAQGMTRIHEGCASWKNPALTLRLIERVEPTLSGGSWLS